MYGRFVWGLRAFLRQRITLEQAQEIVRGRLAERGENFLRLVERGVFGHPGSPYLPLLKLAGCELGDLQVMVRSRGLEETLLALHQAGVYVAFEEFKGRAPIVRDGRVFEVKAHDFDNPYLQRAYHGTTGGSTGAGTRVEIDLEHIAASNAEALIGQHATGILGVPTAIRFGTLPDPTGVVMLLRGAQMGNVARRWFAPVTARNLRPMLKYRLATYTIVTLARAFGANLPRPELLPVDRSDVIARWAASMVRAHGACLVRGNVSMMQRIGMAAREQGIDLHGVTFMGGGEPPTAAKVREMTSSGARWVPVYAFTEAGRLGLGCGNPIDGTDVHLMRDLIALIQVPHLVQGTEVTVPAFCFSSLLSTAPKILLNVEVDDYGIVEQRDCGCPLGELGYTDHLRQIHSYSKLTGEGVTLLGSEMLHILQAVLPARFGGKSLDYQLLEEEDQQGFTRLSIVVSPRVQIDDESAVVQTVLQALGEGSASAELTRAIWSQSETLRVRRQEPMWTARGKLLPIRFQHRSDTIEPRSPVGDHGADHRA